MKIFCIIILVILFEESRCKHPVLLVPGDGGSHLHVQYSKPPHVYCGRENKWMLLWFNAYYILFPFALDCFIKSATLEYDKSTQRTSSPNFCDIRVPGFGDLDSIDYISNVKISKTSYYYYLINDLVMNHGYDPHTDIRGAPYDFRKSPNEMQEFMRDMKNLIEEMYEVNRKSVVIVGHSLGTLYLTLLLHTMTQEWKNKYINTFISVSGPYGGAVDALQTVLSGRNEHIWTVNPAKVQPVQSSWPSTYFLMPSMDLWTTKTVVSIKKMTFNTSSILNLLKMSKIPNAVEHYKVTLSKINIGDFDEFDIEDEVEIPDYQAFIYIDEKFENNDINIKKFIIATDLSTSLFLQENVMSGKENLIATIQLPIKGNIKNTLYQTNSNDKNILVHQSVDKKIIYCLCKLTIPNEYAYSVVEQMLTVIGDSIRNSVQVLVFSRYSSTEFRRNYDDLQYFEFPIIRCLGTNPTRKPPGMILLEPPNMVSGVPAQIVTVSKHRGISTLAYFIYANSLYGIDIDRESLEGLVAVLVHHGVSVQTNRVNTVSSDSIDSFMFT